MKKVVIGLNKIMFHGGIQMAEFVAFDPGVEVRGVTILSVTMGLGDTVIPLLEKYSFHPIQEDSWYNQQAWLNTFQELKAGNFLNMVAIGMNIPDLAVWPPQVTTVHEALGSIDVAYHMNHRNGEIGSYHYTATGERTGVMVCNTPYPSDFDYGLIYRIVQKFRDQTSTKFTVKRDDTIQNRKTGGDECVYHIDW